ISKEIFSELGYEFSHAIVQNGFVSIVPLNIAIVRCPTHPFRLRRQIPLLRIIIAQQETFDLDLTPMRAVVGIQELRSICDSTCTQSLAAAKLSGARRLPEHRHSAIRNRADKVPLAPAKVSLTSYKVCPFVSVLTLKTKPTPL